MTSLRVPTQHGAWAFMVVPLVLASVLGATSWFGLVFAVAWVAAYPASYFGGRALIYRIRRGEWSRKARTELTAALPWAIVAAVLAAALVIHQPLLLVAGIGIGVIWAISLRLTWLGRERGIANDVLLVVLASTAPLLMWLAGASAPLPAMPSGIWLASLLSLLFFLGSVLHVKSLIREADDRRWHVASIAYHAVVVIGVGFISPWLLLPFGAALLRTIVMRPPLRPGVIGAVEAGVSVLLVIGAVLAG